jgi:hypothetical protein
MPDYRSRGVFLLIKALFLHFHCRNLKKCKIIDGHLIIVFYVRCFAVFDLITTCFCTLLDFLYIMSQNAMSRPRGLEKGSYKTNQTDLNKGSVKSNSNSKSTKQNIQNSNELQKAVIQQQQQSTQAVRIFINISF